MTNHVENIPLDKTSTGEFQWLNILSAKLLRENWIYNPLYWTDFRSVWICSQDVDFLMGKIISFPIDIQTGRIPSFEFIACCRHFADENHFYAQLWVLQIVEMVCGSWMSEFIFLNESFREGSVEFSEGHWVIDYHDLLRFLSSFFIQKPRMSSVQSSNEAGPPMTMTHDRNGIVTRMRLINDLWKSLVQSRMTLNLH